MVRTIFCILLVLVLLSVFSESFRAAKMGRKGVFSMLARGLKSPAEFQYSGKLRPGTISPGLFVPAHIQRPDYALTGIPSAKGSLFMSKIITQTPEDIQRMRVAGRHAREVLDAAVRMVRPGITTEDIDNLVHAETIARNCYPSPLNYNKYPKSCCTSLNEVICHGIPDTTVLKNGDIINIDVTVFHDGVHGDCSETVFVGEPEERVRELVTTTFDSFKAAIAICKPGIKVVNIVLRQVIKCVFILLSAYCTRRTVQCDWSGDRGHRQAQGILLCTEVLWPRVRHDVYIFYLLVVLLC